MYDDILGSTIPEPPIEEIPQKTPQETPPQKPAGKPEPTFDIVVKESDFDEDNDDVWDAWDFDEDSLEDGLEYDFS